MNGGHGHNPSHTVGHSDEGTFEWRPRCPSGLCNEATWGKRDQHVLQRVHEVGMAGKVSKENSGR